MHPNNILALKHFIEFYGPSKSEYEDFKRSTRKQEDDKMRYINMVLEYWFENREKLKNRSQLHFILLIQEDKKKEVDLLKHYYKTYKPKKYKEENLE